MPIWEKYRHYFDIDPDYFPAVNEAVINSKPDMWKKFFPHETFVKLLRNTVNVLDRKQKLSIWVEGAYGTGKSHAVLTEKKLLDANAEETKAYFERYHLDMDLYNNLQRIKESGKILTVHRYGSSNIYGDNDLVLAVQESVEKALAAAGIENQGADSLRESVIRYLSDEENKQSFNVYVQGSYRDLFGGDDVDAIVQKLKVYQDAPLHTLMEKIFKVARERQIRVFTMTVRDLCDWLIDVMHANGLKAIVFIWDEFTEYFYNNARNLTGFQELCELSETEPFYFILVTHVSTSLFSEDDKDFIKLNGRFVNPHSQISLPENIAFQLMGTAMEKNKDETILEDWKGILDDLADRTKDSRKAVKGIANISDKEMLDILPIHPYTALLLKHLSSAFGSNQRSMFDFIKNDRGDEIKGFQWFIDNFGPEDDNPLLTIDMLWEFFYDQGRDLLTQNIRSILDYFTRRSNQKLDPDEKRVLKTVLLLDAISQHAGETVDLLIPNEKNIDLAFEGSDLEDGASRIAERLVRDKVLFKKQLGAGKFQYAAYISEVDEAELEQYKKKVDEKDTFSIIQEKLADQTTVAEAITLHGALGLRYELQPTSVKHFEQVVREIRNREIEREGRIPAVVCFAKDEREAVSISQKIKYALENENTPVVFIDATTTPFGVDSYEQYRNEIANADYQAGKENTLHAQYVKNAQDVLKSWKNRIAAGGFFVYTKEKPAGERANTMDALLEILLAVDKERFPRCLEGEYHVLPTMFGRSQLKLGVECGVTRKTRQMYSSGNVNTKLETALKEAWDDPVYWKTRPNLLVSKIKIDVDHFIQEAFEIEAGQVSIRSLYDMLKAKPYGFMPCSFTAFILGFVLKEYLDGSYNWSDGLTNDELTLDKLKEMVNEVISLQYTPNPRYRDKYIVKMTDAGKAFYEITSYAFGISLNLCTSVEQTRDYIRNKMKEFSFPIWTIKFVLQNQSLQTDQTVLKKLIDSYCGIANSNNLDKTKTDNEIASSIGELSIQYPKAKEDLKAVLTKENCTEGMRAYVQDFEGGALVSLADEIGDNGQYINVLRSKFDADAANWVWNVETAQQKIRETIVEYRIIAESNRVLPKYTSFSDTIREWCNKCDLIRISYAASKDYLGDVAPFLELLHTIKKAGTILDSQKQKFLDLLIAHAQEFNTFYDNQIDLFKEVCAYYLDDFSDEEIRVLYQTIPAGTFTNGKNEYLTLVERKVKEYRDSLNKERLKKFWSEKTKTASPRQWSKDHLMPILCLVPDEDVLTARAAFNAVNQSRPDADSVEKALAYLEKASFYSVMNDQKALDHIFQKRILKSYAVMLTNIDDVKVYLNHSVSAEPYEWFGLPEVDKKLKQMAEDKYVHEGYIKALEKIDGMEVDEVKRYLKELVKDNMIVGMEIIKKN